MPAKLPLEFYSAAIAGVSPAGFSGRLLVLEGPASVGLSTQAKRIKTWLEQAGHAVLLSELGSSALAGPELRKAQTRAPLGNLTSSLLSITDLADRLENEIIPALQAGFTVLSDRYLYSVLAGGLVRGGDREWLERSFGFALVPHAIFYLRAEPADLVQRLVQHPGHFDYWQSGMDLRLGRDLHESFIAYQSRILRALDGMEGRYNFIRVDARRPAEAVFRTLLEHLQTFYPQ